MELIWRFCGVKKLPLHTDNRIKNFTIERCLTEVCTDGESAPYSISSRHLWKAMKKALIVCAKQAKKGETKFNFNEERHTCKYMQVSFLRKQRNDNVKVKG